MAGIEADWVGKTPEEFAGQKEFVFKITMTGEISIYATNQEIANEIAKDMTDFDLLAHIDNVDLEVNE